MQWPVSDGQIRPDVDQDVIKVAAIDRAHNPGKTYIGLIMGFGLKSGAMACSAGWDTSDVIIAEPLIVHRTGSKIKRRQRAAELLDMVAWSRMLPDDTPMNFQEVNDSGSGLHAPLHSNPNLLLPMNRYRLWMFRFNPRF
jgi:hypothetical protein